MGIFNSDFAAAQRAKRRIHQLKKELAFLTDRSHIFDSGLKSGKIIELVRSRGHDALDSFSNQMQDFGKSMKKNPGWTTAAIVGISTLTILLIARIQRHI